MRVLLAAVAVVFGGCVVDLDLSGATFLCSAANPECPDGFVCDGTRCQPQGQRDAAADGSSSDALASCGDGLCTETCTSCTADCGQCLAGMLLFLPGDSEPDTTPTDASGTGRQIVQTNVGRVPSPNGTAYSFDGNGSQLVVEAPMDLVTAEFTLAAFVRSTAVTMFGQEVASMGDVWALRIVPDGNLRVFAYNGTLYDSCQSTMINLLDNEWHHVLGQRTGDVLEIYVDGTLANSCAMPDPIVYAFGDDFVVGHHGTGQELFRYTGDIDEVRVFNRGLSQTEISDLAN